jgi:membrane protease YdiL (CAAX protease family)
MKLLAFLLLTVVVGTAVARTSESLFSVDESAWTASFLLVAGAFGGLGIVATVIAASVMGFFEGGRDLSDYGLPFPWREWRLLTEGILWGGLAVTLLVLLVALAGGASFHGFAESAGLAPYLWILTMGVLALSEEFLFRGYPLFTLSSGVGFWPASLILSLAFGALHYFGKPMETWADGFSITLIGLFLCLTVQRTGSLWFAIGFHAAFNYAALVVFSSPNSGNHGRPVEGHLIEVVFHGPSWLTGGPCGLEASLFVFVILAAVFFLIDRRFPHRDRQAGTQSAP